MNREGLEAWREALGVAVHERREAHDWRRFGAPEVERALGRMLVEHGEVAVRKALARIRARIEGMRP